MRDATDGLLRGVSERSNSKLMSTGECRESGEFGELPEGDKGGVYVPLTSEILEKYGSTSDRDVPTALWMSRNPGEGRLPTICTGCVANIAARATAWKPLLPTPAIPASPPILVSGSGIG